MWYRRFFPWQPNWANGFKFKLKKNILFTIGVEIPSFAKRFITNEQKKQYCNSNNKTKRQQYRSREKQERDGQRGSERDGEKMTSHSASSEQKEFGNKTNLHIQCAARERIACASAGARTHQEVLFLYFTLLYSTPYRLLCIFFSLTFSLQHIRAYWSILNSDFIFVFLL